MRWEVLREMHGYGEELRGDEKKGTSEDEEKENEDEEKGMNVDCHKGG